MKNNYYYLVSSIPELFFDNKKGIDISLIYDEIYEGVSDSDKRIVEQLFEPYEDVAKKCSNKFINNWFELDYNIRKCCMDFKATGKIVNVNESEYIARLTTILNGSSAWDIEKEIDMLRWEYLEEATIFDYFSAEYLFAFLIKLKIANRWASINPIVGRELFLSALNNLKDGVNIEDKI